VKRSKSEIYLHFVWATHQRLPLITSDMEPHLYNVLIKQAECLGCKVLALGGLPDHVHLLLRMPAKRSPSELMQQIKGASSASARVNVRPTQRLSAEPFGWQDGYGVFSLSRSHLKRVVAYIENQKKRHASGKLWPEWEEVDEEV
jgi:REP element-mobilizing transposase RayT